MSVQCYFFRRYLWYDALLTSGNYYRAALLMTNRILRIGSYLQQRRIRFGHCILWENIFSFLPALGTLFSRLSVLNVRIVYLEKVVTCQVTCTCLNHVTKRQDPIGCRLGADSAIVSYGKTCSHFFLPLALYFHLSLFDM